MSQVQNNTLHKYVQPTVLVAIALIAGSKRCIQFFPGASQGGLLLAAGLGVGATYASPHISTPAFLQTDQKSEHALHSLIRVTASLALGTLTAHFADKLLKGRVSLCLHAAGRFIALETVIALGFAGISSFQTAPTPGGGDPKTLEGKHAAYLKNPDTWNKLDGKERSDFAKECFEKDLPALPLKDGDFDIKLFAELPKQDVAKLTANQLEWFSAIYMRGLTLTVEQEFALNSARDAQKLDATWVDVTEAHIKYAFDQNQETLLHGYYSTHADAWNKLDDKTRGAFVNAWFKADLPVISLEKANVCTEALQKDLPDDISSCTKNQIEWMTELSPHLKIPMESQFALNAARQEEGLNPVWDDKGMPPEYVEYALHQDKAALLHGYFSENPLALPVIESKTNGITAAFNKASGLTPIQNAHDALINLKTDEIDSLTKGEAHFASAYIESDKTLTDFNKLSPEQQIAFNITFSNHEIKTHWIWPITEEHLAAIQNLEGAVGWAHQEFVRAPVAFAAIEDKVRESLVQLFVANGKSSIEDAHELLRSLTVEGIEQFGQPDAWDWNQFFEAYPNKWSDVDSEIQQAFCESFIAHNIEVDVPEDADQLQALPQERIEFLLMLQKNGFEMDAQLLESLSKHLQSLKE